MPSDTLKLDWRGAPFDHDRYQPFIEGGGWMDLDGGSLANMDIVGLLHMEYGGEIVMGSQYPVVGATDSYVSLSQAGIKLWGPSSSENIHIATSGAARLGKAGPTAIFIDAAGTVTVPWAALPGRPAFFVDQMTGGANINNSAAETTIGTVTIPAGIMESDRSVRFDLVGYFTNALASPGATTVRIRIKFGGTTYYDATSVSIAQSAVSRAFRLQGRVQNTTNASTQVLSGEVSLGGVDATVAGTGGLGPALFAAPIQGFPSKDTASAQVLLVTAQLGTADANISLVTFDGMVTLE